MSLLPLLLMSFVLAGGSPAYAVDPCTPLPEPEITVELLADIVDPVVGDRVEFSADVHDSRRVPVRNITFEVVGWQTRFVEPNDIVIVFPGGNDPLPYPDLNIRFFAIRRVAAYRGPAEIRFAVHYDLARGCAEAPHYEPRTSWSAPLHLDVIAANACRGDCDDNHQVTADEIQRLILAALTGSEDDPCATAYDPDLAVGVDDLLQATSNALLGCPARRTCGGVHQTTCPSREWCDFPAGTCGADAAEGVCRERDQVFCLERADPQRQVCGCDAVTYRSDCLRAAAGVALDHAGPCASEGP